MKRNVKKAISMLLSLALIVSCCTIGVTVLATGETEQGSQDLPVWQGEVATAFSEGLGTAEKPWLIGNGDELALAITSGGNGQYYKLTSDIILNDIDAINWTDGTYTAEKVNPWSATTFSGTIDGDGHVIYGIYINEAEGYASTPSFGRGLITKVNGAVKFENLGIDNIYVNTAGAAAAFVGFAGGDYGGYLEMNNCFVGENATLIGSAAGSFAAWGNCPETAEGEKNYVIIDSCYSLATPVGKNYSGENQTGFMGAMWGKYWSVSNSYALTYVTTSLNGTCLNNYSATQGAADATNVALITEDNMQGNLPLIHMTGLGADFVTTEGYPTLAVFVKNAASYSVANLPLDWANGSGTEADPYLISTAADLYKAVGLYGQGKYYKFTKDIYLNDITAIDWTTSEVITQGYEPLEWFGNSEGHTSYIGLLTAEQIGNSNSGFYGHIDGDGYSVSGIYYKQDTAYRAAALLPVTASPTNKSATNAKVSVKNLMLKNSYLCSNKRTGGFVGQTQWGVTLTLSGCVVDDTVSIYGKQLDYNNDGAGGLFGYAGDTTVNIDNCAVYGTVSGGGAGGLFSKKSAGTLNANDAFCAAKPYYDLAGTKTFTNVYTQAELSTAVDGVSTLSKESMLGNAALENMALSTEVWYAASIGNGYPMLYIHGLAAGDVDKDTVGSTVNDITALRCCLFGVPADEKLTDFNRDGGTNICDLVLMFKKKYRY